MSKITGSAKGRDCTIRLPGICNHNSETVVFCHFRLLGISGLGFKTDAPIGAYGCSSCHYAVDSDKSDVIQLAFAHGCMRTIDILWRDGVIK